MGVPGQYSLAACCPYCLVFSKETLISFTPSSSSLFLRHPVIHQQGPTPGVQTLP